MAAVAAGVALVASGCATDVSTGFLPSDAGVTNRTGELIALWNGSWIAALAVGVLVWGLLLWAIVAYRKRKDDNQLPVQLQDIFLPKRLPRHVIESVFYALNFHLSYFSLCLLDYNKKRIKKKRFSI